MRPFVIDIDQAVLDDVLARVRRTRLPRPAPGEPWAAGTDPAYLAELLAYWADRYDWQSAQRRLNRYPQFMSDVDGAAIHVVHVRAEVEDALPLVLTHGWPSTFAEMLPLVPLLTRPSEHGGEAADAFHVVVPDLPGFGFSDPLPGPATEPAIAAVWAELMTRLGYDRFGAYGGDVGSGVSTWLGATFPERVVGIHTQHIKFPPARRRAGLNPREEAFVAALDAKAADDYGYGVMQQTRPDTLAAALTDSPSGLAAWIVEKFQRWSDCGGDVERRFTKDDLLTTIMLYWVTGCVATSFRVYRDDPLTPELPLVRVPAGITVSVEDAGLPREFAERTYADIRHWREPGRGGHFFAMEEPELLAEELRTFFRGLR